MKQTCTNVSRGRLNTFISTKYWNSMTSYGISGDSRSAFRAKYEIQASASCFTMKRTLLSCWKLQTNWSFIYAPSVSCRHQISIRCSSLHGLWYMVYGQSIEAITKNPVQYFHALLWRKSCTHITSHATVPAVNLEETGDQKCVAELKMYFRGIKFHDIDVVFVLSCIVRTGTHPLPAPVLVRSFWSPLSILRISCTFTQN